MVRYDPVGEQSICGILAREHKEDVNKLLDRQEEENAEAWSLIIDTGKGLRFTDIQSGRESEVDVMSIKVAIDDFVMPSVQSIALIHTHPRGKFLSPNDVSEHVKFTREFDSYHATVAVNESQGKVFINGAMNTDTVRQHEQADIISMLQQYQHKLEEEDDPDEFYEIVSEMFGDISKWVDFCTKTYRRDR